jgi:transcriptional regulator with XRE-family HTH domain
MTAADGRSQEQETSVGWLQWNVALRSLREARGITQEGWAALLGVGRTTIQRWESGHTPPDNRSEAAIVELCREQGLFRAYSSGPFRGRTVTPEFLQELLAEARLEPEPTELRERAPLVAPGTAPVGQLVEESAAGDARRHDLRLPVTTLGRSLDNDIVVEHSRVSRHHAQVVFERATYVLHDLQSTNGTYLNGAPVTRPEPLRDADVILLGGPETPRLVIHLPDQAVTAVAGSVPPPA